MRGVGWSIGFTPFTPFHLRTTGSRVWPSTPRVAARPRVLLEGAQDEVRQDGKQAAMSGDRVRYLTVAEVAEMMRLSRMTVYRLVHGGELPAVRVGRSFRVPQDALEAYLKASSIETPDEDRDQLSS